MEGSAVEEILDEAVAMTAARFNVLGVGVSQINMEDAVRISSSLIDAKGRGYICVTDVHGIIEARSDSSFQKILNRSFLTTPDGMPLVWVGRLQGHKRIRRVYGPDYMLELCKASVEKGYRHFLYGGNPGVADRLAIGLEQRFPGVQIVGTYSPPYRPLTPDEEIQLAALISETKPDVLWVGLGSPKQERFMAQYCGTFDVKLMVGVGAAFDIHAGVVKEAPQWVKSAGLQWLDRLIKEPRRLWRRYFTCVPVFIWNICLQLSGIRKFDPTL